MSNLPEKHDSTHVIIDKFNSGELFGLFEEEKKCYFEDGTKVSYSALWAALRVMHQLPPAHHKNLAELCPDTFVGTFDYKYSKHKWKRNTEQKKQHV
jgi:hypothetical protein